MGVLVPGKVLDFGQ